ncbi:MAG: D-aminoacyl-tRNA deacylase [Dehalococcoidia bacterium]|jgi:D-tyrosyl-tRNA(Tyr) deacylase|nr:D-aminoacyl-tRNA deacylase [Dehalococcoidia bacterium]
MRAVLQRVACASVEVEGERVAAIGRGLLILLGVARGDTEAEARKLAQKAAELRIFPDQEGKFNLSLLDIDGEALVVSQFTLLADVRRGRRPSFQEAAPPEEAAPLVETFARHLQELGVPTQMGRFGAYMRVELVNDGPVTIVLDSQELERPRRWRPRPPNTEDLG